MLPTRFEWLLAVRRWTARPALTVTAVGILALGLGFTVSLYSIVDTVLLRKLPWRDPDRLVAVYVTRPHWRTNPVLAGSWERGNLTWFTVKDLQGKSPAFESFSGWRMDKFALNSDTNDLVRVLQVSSNLLSTLGVALQQGRFFTADEDDNPSDVTILAHETWQRRYGGRPDILGQIISLNETRLTVVGVLPPGFRFGAIDAPEFLLPIGRAPLAQRTPGNHFLNGVGRLAPGVTLAEAARAAEPFIRGTEPPDEKGGVLVPLDDDQRSASRRPLLTLLAGAGVLLAIAAANIAALLLGDANQRRHEMAIRAALGGARRQLARQLVAENLALAAASGIAGLLIATWLTPALLSLAPAALPLADTVAIDLRVAAFAFGLTLATSLLFGVGPALVVASAAPTGALRQVSRGGSAPRSRAYRWVVAAQVALAVVLLLGAGLLTETVRQLVSQPLGFDADRLVVTSLRLPPIAGATAAQRAARMQALVDRLAAAPGVRSAAATSTAPFSGSSGGSSFQIPGRTFDRDPNANRHIVTERYFETLGVRLLKGRVFGGTDQSGTHAAVVTDEFERVFMDGDALDKRFVLNGDEHTIIGVIAAPKHRRFTDQPPIAFYALSRQLPAWPTPTLIAKTAGDPEAYLSTLRQIVAAAEPQASFVTLETMTTMTQRSIADERYRAQLALIFGGMAVLLSAIGLYGLVTSVVNERRREMGIRVALGARPTQVRGLVLIHALRLVGAGLLVGVPAALAAAQGLASFLFGVPPTSPAVVLLVVATIAVAAFLAALGPAVRASRIHPAEALRAGS